jgi:NadR type nicotinamide-nucleotide adenylyltransferase
MSGVRLGLTLGKFAPLHRGHQHLIETALAETDHLFVMIYDCPDVTEVPLGVRARWIRDLYPRAEVIEAVGGPTRVGWEPDVTAAHDAYIVRTLAGRRVTHFYSGEFYGAHVSRALGAEDRRVDPERRTCPVSGTAVRESPYGHRQWMSPRVYRDLIRNVLVLGAPSTGKTTLCQRLAARFRTQWMPEYGREYWETHQQDRRLSPEQLVEIAEGHLEREEQLLLESNRYLFTDTNALTTLLFARHYHGYGLPRLVALADAATSRYSTTFLCGDDIPYEDTWDRSGEANRREFQEWTLEELRQRGIAHTEVTGSVEEREARIVEVLGQHSLTS